MNFIKTEAIQSLCPGAEFVLRGDVLEWYDTEQTQPTEAQIDAEIARLAAEQPLVELRAKRNQLLTETDYLAFADSTLTDEMRSYRQALRDLPANTVDPANPVWPVKPGGN